MESVKHRSMHGATSSFWFHIQKPPNHRPVGGSLRSHSRAYDLHRIVYVQQRTYKYYIKTHLIMWPMSNNALNYVAYVKQRT